MTAVVGRGGGGEEGGGGGGRGETVALIPSHSVSSPNLPSFPGVEVVLRWC